MTETIPALILYARRIPSTRGALVETLASGLGVLATADRPARSGIGRWLRILDRNSYASLSYVIDWLDAFRTAPDLQAECINIVDLGNWPRIRQLAKTVPLIVILHSAAGDDLSLISKLGSTLQRRRGKLLTFFGNEYTRMPEKIALARDVEADFIASQLPMAAANWLYAECVRSRILPAPAALNPTRYFPLETARDLDIGFRGDLYPFSIGDQSRTQILEFFRTRGAAYDLAIDMAYRRETGARWHQFLSRCHGIVGAESGTRYLERDDHTERAVVGYLASHPAATFDEIHALFFAAYANPVCGKAISSRHFEAIGTQTCQILLAGQYNGILEAGRHYLSVRADLTNVDEVVARFKDPAERSRIALEAHAFALAHHTYPHRVAHLLETALA